MRLVHVTYPPSGGLQELLNWMFHTCSLTSVSQSPFHGYSIQGQASKQRDKPCTALKAYRVHGG